MQGGEQMKRMAAITVLTAAATAHAGAWKTWTGNDVLEILEGTDTRRKTTLTLYAMGYINAANDWAHVCLPAGMTGEQVVAMVKDRIEKTPEFRHNNIDVFLGSVVLENACEKAKK